MSQPWGYPPQQPPAYPQQQGWQAPQGYYQGYPQPYPPQPPQPSRFDGKFWAGLVLTVVGCLIGLGLIVKVFISDAPDSQADLTASAAVIAYLPVGLYLLVPYLIDRYDPEPIWALAGVFAWGALFATGAAAVVNTYGGMIVAEITGDRVTGEVYSLAVSAPIFEELFKGLAILGMVTFLHREFDGVVDGIIYGTFAALGFAATENIIYYARADRAHQLQDIFVLRGILTPWLHPLFTSMTGIGFGLARESTVGWKKVVYPMAGYLTAVMLHSWWNGLPTITALLVGKNEGNAIGAINLVVGILMALVFFVIVCVLVYRKGKTMKKYLYDELLIGTISQEEYDLITSYGGRLKARMSWRGKAGADFVRAGARLALSKYHTARAMAGSKRTVSMEFIAPLRQELARLRQQMTARR